MSLSFVRASLLRSFFLAYGSTVLLSCGQQETGRQVIRQQESATAPAEKKKPVPEQEDRVVSLPDFEHLYPVEIVKPGSTDVYEKYGIGFSGVCYACDLAEIKINPAGMDFINVCDAKDIARVRGFKYEMDENRLLAEADGQVLVFTKVDAAPVYALEIRGKSFSFKNKRIMKYYVPRQIITKFKQHDCGDFQG